jgi:protein involved in polysaccharide export with SLBB domain
VRSFRSLAPALFLAALAPLAIVAAPLAGQSRPSPSQAEAALRNNPELLNQLRERVMNSGMTPEQLRARLRAEGYSESLLDDFLDRSGGSLRNATAPNPQVFSAMRDLGLTDDADLAELMRMAGLQEQGQGRDRFGAARQVDSLSLRDSTISPASAEVFGLSLFRSSSSLFLPNLDGPVDAGYRIGPGDQLTLVLTGDVEQAHTLDVSREGYIRIPDVGQLSVANLTLGELEDVLYARLGRVHSGVRRGANATTRFSVSVTRLRSNQVFVTGDVMNPGSYRVTSAGTALTALYAAGGPTDRGSLRRVEVRRGGRLVSSLDVYDYLVRGDASNDVRLQQGDIVHVPVHGPRVRVDGAVARPATYEVKDREGIAQVIQAAGGLRAVAGGRRLVIERVLPVADRSMGRQRAVIDVPLGADGTIPAFAVADGDLVRVPGISDRVRDRVVVQGHVWSPGPQGFAAGLTLEEALRRAGGLQPDAYLGTVHVSRLRPDSTRVQLRAMLRDTTGATVAPLTLQEDDEVMVYSRTSFRPEQYVVIGGAVRDGKRFPWREGMTLRDLVLLAGGLTESAYLNEAEIARIPEVRDVSVTATTIRVPLDSGYLFELATAADTPTDGDVVLEPYDNVLILKDPDWREPRSVWLTGEVRFPGRYTLTNRGSRLSDVLKRAGGLTREADPAGAYFTRRADSTLIERLETARRRLPDTLSGNDTSRTARVARQQRDSLDRAFLAQDDTAERQQPRIRVGVDLRAAMRGRSDDLTLEDGDSLHVPARSEIVEVRGAVNAPTALAHARGATLSHYVSSAGGTTELARTRRAYVIQPSGKIETRRYLLWLIPLDPTPLPGSVVVVPERPPSDNSARTIQTLGIVAQVIASLATIIVISK